jgi:hypothetical protein
MTDSSAQFAGRVYVVEENGGLDLVIWVDEFVPMNLKNRPAADWVTEHIQAMSESDLRKGLMLPPQGNFQVLYKGMIRGYRCGEYNSEFDEELVFTEHSSQPVPEDWLPHVLSDPLNA